MFSYKRSRAVLRALTVVRHFLANEGNFARPAYFSKDRKVFTALDCLARLVTHIPGWYEQTVRYYGHHLYKSRGMRKKQIRMIPSPTRCLPKSPARIGRV